MTAEEFLQLAASQDAVEVEQEVCVSDLDALGPVNGVQPVTLQDFLRHPDVKTERRKFRYGHLVEPGIRLTDLDAWQNRFLRFPLPDDLRRFLLLANGVQLWADLETRHSYFRLLPLERWHDVVSAPFAYIFKVPPTAALVLSDADDFAGFVVLDTDGPEYLWCDPIAGPERIGNSVGELLTYWWDNCALEP
ncbi:MAG: SMI1/KNR4 family protein [Polyangiaceae bacterium]|nr:SMI1/KNR4 family protein [Polyangiaceae bacterium]